MKEQIYSAVSIRTNKKVTGKLISKVSPHFTDMVDDRGNLHIVFSNTLKTIQVCGYL